MESKILIQFHDTSTQKESAQFQVPLKIKKNQLLELSETKGTLFYNGNVIINDLFSVLPKDFNNEELVLIKISDEKEQKPATYCSSSFSGHENAVLGVASANEDVYTIGGDCTIRKWNALCKLQSKIVNEHKNWVQVVRIFDDFVCTGSMDTNVCIFDRNLELLTKIVGHTDGITGIERLNNFFITSSRDKSVKFWIKDENQNEIKYKCVYSYAHDGIVMGIKVFGDKLYSYSKDGLIKIYKSTTYQSEIRVYSQINSISIHGENIYFGCEDGSIYKNKKVIAKMNNLISSIDVSENGIFLIAGSFSKKVSIFTTDGVFVSDYMHFNSVYKVRIKNQMAYSSGKDKTIKIYSLKDKKIVSDLICKDEVYDFDICGNRVIAACKDSKVYFFD